MDEKSGIGFVNASRRNLERKIHGGARSSRKKAVPIDQQTVGRSDRRERENAGNLKNDNAIRREEILAIDRSIRFFTSNESSKILSRNANSLSFRRISLRDPSIETSRANSSRDLKNSGRVSSFSPISFVPLDLKSFQLLEREAKSKSGQIWKKLGASRLGRG